MRGRDSRTGCFDFAPDQAASAYATGGTNRARSQTLGAAIRHCWHESRPVTAAGRGNTPRAARIAPGVRGHHLLKGFRRRLMWQRPAFSSEIAARAMRAPPRSRRSAHFQRPQVASKVCTSNASTPVSSLTIRKSGDIARIRLTAPTEQGSGRRGSRRGSKRPCFRR